VVPEKSNPASLVLGGEKGTRGSEADLASRLRRYGTAKAHTLNVLTQIGDERLRQMGIQVPSRVHQCGDWLKFRHYFTVDQVKLAAANFCKKHLLCGLCAIRRASRLMAAYLDRFNVIRAAQPELVPFLVTITVKNSHDLDEVLAHLLASLRLLHRRRNNKRQPSVMHGIAGGVYAVELTHDAETGWHPHVHAIWLASLACEPNTYALRSEWESITGDSFMCDVRQIAAEQQESPDIDPHAGGFAECFKYAMKPAELGADRMEVAYPILAGRRLVGSFGAFRGVPEPEALTDDLTGMESLPYEEFLYRYFGGNYRSTTAAARLA
jgi:hypothetical protein